jgi:hypothetical protein
MKNNIKIIALTVLFYFLFSFGSKPLLACKCACTDNPNPSQALSQSTAVFTGKVINLSGNLVSTENFEGDVTFKVAKIWKGSPTKNIVVHVRYGCCGSHEFTMSREYLVYADGSDNKLYESGCSRTTLLNDASKDLQLLGDGKVPTLEPINSFDRSILPTIGGISAVATSTVIFYLLRKKRKNNLN